MLDANRSNIKLLGCNSVSVSTWQRECVLDLKRIRHFVTLASTLNFHRAAEQLHIAQPALSISIRRLEEEMGVNLFVRGRRKVLLSDAGKAALPDAVKALDSAARMTDQARAAAAGNVGTLKLAFVATATYHLLPCALEHLRESQPGIRVELHEENTDNIVAGLESRRFDVGLVRYPLKSMQGMVIEVVEEDFYCIALARQHRLARRRKLALADLSTEPFLVPSAAQNPTLNSQVLLACQRAGFMPLVAAQKAVQISTVIALVEGGFGVALVPEMVAKRMRRNVVFRRLDNRAEGIPTGLALLYPDSNHTPLLSQFRQAVLAVPNA